MFQASQCRAMCIIAQFFRNCLLDRIDKIKLHCVLRTFTNVSIRLVYYLCPIDNIDQRGLMFTSSTWQCQERNMLYYINNIVNTEPDRIISNVCLLRLALLTSVNYRRFIIYLII